LARNAMPADHSTPPLEVWLMWRLFVVEQWFLELGRGACTLRLARQR
jgi:hypothetical protein